MSTTAQIIAATLRLLAVGFWVWASLHAVVVLTHPIAIWICQYTQHEPIDPRQLTTIGSCAIAGIIAYFASVPLALRMDAGPGHSAAYSIAFASLRLLATCAILFSLVWMALGVADIVIYWFRHSNGQLPPVADRARFLARRLFEQSFAPLLLGMMWPLSHNLSGLITRRFGS